MTALKWLWQAWISNGTRILGIAIGIDAALATIEGLIPPGTLKYHLAFIAVATFLRGQMNSNAIAAAATDAKTNENGVA